MEKSFQLQKTLKKYWGYDSFRPLQEEIIKSVIEEEKDTLALLPTGGGKSLCYQLPGIVMEGLCLVISPLIALMNDQVRFLNSIQVKSVAIHSGLSYRDIDRELDNCVFGKTKFLFISPERIETDLFSKRVQKMNVNLIAVDEAHCISQWGHDFRPSYQKISLLKEMKPGVPVLALTATATPEVLKDIQESLEMQDPRIYKKSFRRDNISFHTIHSEDKLNFVADRLQKVDGSSIIYARSRKGTKTISNYLNQRGIQSSFYHAGLSMEKRNVIQEDWIKGITKNIVATNAFGMGIDKPDVRLVMHIDLPPGLEEYYQEAGRAGRDGLPSEAILVYDESNIQRSKVQFLDSFPAQDIIKKVYRALSIYLNLAIGSGEGQAFDFDLKSFVDQYGLNISTSYYALRELERSGYILMNESVSNPSRVRFELDKSSMYDFIVDHQQFEKLIKVILRSYEGVFNDYVKISESILAKSTGYNEPQLIRNLYQLHKLRVINYRPKSQGGKVVFLKERFTSDNLKVDSQSFEFRKNMAFKRLEGMIKYLKNDSCKQSFICDYFGEKESFFCGKCNYCLMKEKGQPLEIKNTIIADIQKGSIDFKSYLNQWPLDKRKTVLDFLTYFEGEDFIIIKEGKILWQGKKTNS